MWYINSVIFVHNQISGKKILIYLLSSSFILWVIKCFALILPLHVYLYVCMSRAKATFPPICHLPGATIP